MPYKHLRKRDDLKIQELYISGLSTRQIAVLVKHSATTIRKSLHRTATPMREGRDYPQLNRARNTAHPHWNGGRTKSIDGYVYILREDAEPGSKGLLRYISEHRQVWEMANGRKLQPDEVVHHINGDRADNRIENLVALTRSHHMRHHMGSLTPEHRRKLSESGKLAWSKRKAT